MTNVLVLRSDGRDVSFSYAEMLKYHGGNSPGGVAHAFKALERALPLLHPDGRPERKEITIETAFGGPGARDAFELVTRAVTQDRFVLDPALARPQLGRARERFVFRLGARGRPVTLVLRAGFVSDAFINLTRLPNRSEAQERTLDTMKAEMADRVMAAEARAVYDAE